MSTIKQIPLEEAQPGMLLGDDLRDAAGQVLLPRGSELAESSLRSLARRGIETLTIRIEEPAEGRLFLRFTYQTSFAEGPDPEARAYVGYLESAYHAADLDTVAEIRRQMERGLAH